MEKIGLILQVHAFDLVDLRRHFRVRRKAHWCRSLRRCRIGTTVDVLDGYKLTGATLSSRSRVGAPGGRAVGASLVDGRDDVQLIGELARRRVRQRPG